MAKTQKAQESLAEEENFIDTQIDEGIIPSVFRPTRDKREIVHKEETVKGNSSLYLSFKYLH